MATTPPPNGIDYYITLKRFFTRPAEDTRLTPTLDEMVGQTYSVTPAEDVDESALGEFLGKTLSAYGTPSVLGAAPGKGTAVGKDGVAYTMSARVRDDDGYTVDVTFDVYLRRARKGS